MGRPRFRSTFLTVTFALCYLATLATTQGTRCRDDITENTDEGKSTSSRPSWTQLTCDRQSQSDFPIGITTVTCTDPNTEETCTFRVIITDDEKPTIKCPLSQRVFVPDFAVRSGPEEAAVAVGWDAPAARDNSGSQWFAEPSPTHRSGSVFPLGRTRVTYTARDYSGNVNTDCQFDVRVLVQPPKNRTTAWSQNSESITVLFPQLGDSVKQYYILQYEDKSARDESYSSRTFFSATNNDTFIQHNLQGDISPGHLYFLEVGTDESGSPGIISTVQQWAKPKLDSQIDASWSSNTSILITFTPGTSTLEQYLVTVIGDFGVFSDTVYQSYLQNDAEQVVVDSLVPGLPYVVSVRAVVGSGEMREMSGSVNPPFDPPVSLLEDQFVAYNYTESTISVAWKKNDATEDQDEPYMLFIYTEDGEVQPTESFRPDFEYTNNPTKTAEFKGLLANTLYHVRLITNAGLFLHLSQATRHMRVSNLRPTEVLNDSITLEWDPVSSDVNAIYTYEVTISPKPGSDYQHTSTSNTRTIGSLVTGTEYFFTVVSILDGKKSVPQSITVTAGVSLVPSPLNTKAIIVGVVLGVFNLILAIVLFIICRKYNNLKGTPGTTGHTNDAMERTKEHEKGQKQLDDDETGAYEMPAVTTPIRTVDITAPYENTMIASNPPLRPPVKAKPKPHLGRR